MKAYEISEILSEYAGLTVPADFDNCGFICGDSDAEVTGVLVCLDVTAEAVQTAFDNGLNMVISHHPLVFNAIKNVLTNDYIGNIVSLAIKKDIVIYAAHTNIDAAKEGLCFKLASAIGLKDIEVLDAFSVIGEIEGVTLNNFALNIEKITGDKHIKTAGELNKLIKRVVVANGSGGRDENLVALAKLSGADAFVSAEFKYSNILDLVGSGVSVVELGHYDSEKHFVPYVTDLLRKNIKGLRVVKYFYNPYN